MTPSSLIRIGIVLLATSAILLLTALTTSYESEIGASGPSYVNTTYCLYLPPAEEVVIQVGVLGEERVEGKAQVILTDETGKILESLKGRMPLSLRVVIKTRGIYLLNVERINNSGPLPVMVKVKGLERDRLLATEVLALAGLGMMICGAVKSLMQVKLE